MRFLACLALATCPTLSNAEGRFGDWVAEALGYQPFYAQSIGWDMPQTSVTIADPLSEIGSDAGFIITPDSTAWVVGILQSPSDARLSGLALVWSDKPFDRVVSQGATRTQSGFVAFQTPHQTWISHALPQTIATQMNAASPGPILVAQPDGTLFPVGDSGISDGCLETFALYNDTDALMAFVVLFQPHARGNGDSLACIPLTS